MSIRSVQVRHFRSVANAELANCGGLNILIGKNNAGKSNLLNAIELMLEHLKRGRIAGPWEVERAQAEFTDRNESTPIRIGVEFELAPKTIESLQEICTNVHAVTRLKLDHWKAGKCRLCREGVPVTFSRRLTGVGPLRPHRDASTAAS